MKHKKSKYHKLYSLLKNADDYFPLEDREEVLDLVKELYQDNNVIEGKLDKDGKYGIKYKTIEEDSKFTDTHTDFFLSKEKRDAIYDDWINDRYWDIELDTELFYSSPNLHNIEKVFKEGDKIYVEK